MYTQNYVFHAIRGTERSNYLYDIKVTFGKQQHRRAERTKHLHDMALTEVFCYTKPENNRMWGITPCTCIWGFFVQKWSFWVIYATSDWARSLACCTHGSVGSAQMKSSCLHSYLCRKCKLSCSLQLFTALSLTHKRLCHLRPGLINEPFCLTPCAFLCMLCTQGDWTSFLPNYCTISADVCVAYW